MSTVAVFAALSGGAYAAVSSIPDSKGVFHACAKRGSGAMRVVKSARSCRRAERKLAWNARGRTGPRGAVGPQGAVGPDGAAGQPGQPGQVGPTGPQGPTGADGQVGPSEAFGASRDEVVNIGSTSATSPTTVATLSELPPGAYAISAKTTITTGDGQDIACSLTAGSDSDRAETSLGTGGPNDYTMTEPMQLLHTYDTTGSARVACYALSSGALFPNASETRITAIKLGSEQNFVVAG